MSIKVGDYVKGISNGKTYYGIVTKIDEMGVTARWCLDAAMTDYYADGFIPRHNVTRLSQPKKGYAKFISSMEAACA